MRTPRFPQEIIDQIIDHLHDDLSALAQCSLTNSAWLPSVRVHRYWEVKVTYKSVKAFQGLLEAVPEIGIYVQSLGVDFSLFEGLRFIYVPEMSSILHILLPKLPFIRNLRLEHTLLPEPFFMPTTITSVSIVEVGVESPTAFLEWLARLPCLRSLAFVGIRHPRHDDGSWDLGNGWIEVPALPALRPLEAVEEFSISTQIQRTDSDWLLKRLVPSRLRVLSLCLARLGNVQDAPAFQAVLRGVGPALHTLEMSEIFYSTYLARNPSLLFSKCEHLRTIRLWAYIDDSGDSRRFTFEWATTLLGHLGAPNVTTVKFVFDNAPRSCPLDWLKDVLTHVGGSASVLHNLERVVFEIRGHHRMCQFYVRVWNEYIWRTATRLHDALLNDAPPGLKFEVAFLGHGLDTWPVTHARPITVATFISGEKTITWRPGYEPAKLEL